MGKFKMSKSRGNVVDPIAAMDLYGPESVRWYLMRSGGSLPGDSDYSSEELGFAHGILASQIGNLLNRILSPKIYGKMGSLEEGSEMRDLDEKFAGARDEVDKRMEGFHVTKACETIMELLSDVSGIEPILRLRRTDYQANKMFTELEPWKMKNTAVPVLYAYTALRIAGILLRPIMPVKSVELLDRLGVAPAERTWEHSTWDGRGKIDTEQLKTQLKKAGEEWKAKGHLFPRIEVENPK